MRPSVTALALAALVACGGGDVGGEVSPSAPPGTEGATDGAIVPTATYTGANAAYGSDDESAGVACFVAVDAESLARLWALGDAGRIVPPPAPPPDLAEPAVGVFLGIRPTGGYALSLASVAPQGDVLVVEVDVTEPSGGVTTQALTSPYVIIGLPAATAVGSVRAIVGDDTIECRDSVPEVAPLEGGDTGYGGG